MARPYSMDLRERVVQAVEEDALTVAVEHPTFDDWWAPFTLGVGPAGAYVSSLDRGRMAELRELCRQTLGPAPFTISAIAWAARGKV